MKSKDNNSFQEMKKSKFILVRLTWILLGSIFVGVGTVGIFIPGLPTTVFLILAATCYVRSSEKLYNWTLRRLMICLCLLFGIELRNQLDIFSGKEYKMQPFRVSTVSELSSVLLRCFYDYTFYFQ